MMLKTGQYMEHSTGTSKRLQQRTGVLTTNYMAHGRIKMFGPCLIYCVFICAAVCWVCSTLPVLKNVCCAKSRTTRSLALVLTHQHCILFSHARPSIPQQSPCQLMQHDSRKNSVNPRHHQQTIHLITVQIALRDPTRASLASQTMIQDGGRIL